jgi:hypothetical protein
MESATVASPNRSTSRTDAPRDTGVRRLTTETKQAFKTTEFWLTIAVIAGILISAAMTDGAEGFGANQAWLYVAVVTGLYAVGRGAAKSGSRDPYTTQDDNHGRS